MGLISIPTLLVCAAGLFMYHCCHPVDVCGPGSRFSGEELDSLGLAQLSIGNIGTSCATEVRSENQGCFQGQDRTLTSRKHKLILWFRYACVVQCLFFVGITVHRLLTRNLMRLT